MSTLHLSPDQDLLAENLATLLESRPDPFVPAVIVVPNRYLGRWLRLWLSRRFGIAINLDFQYLENSLWQMLRRLDDRGSEVERLDHEHLRLLVLTALSDERESEALKPFQDYLERRGPERRFYRRLWSLSDKLARLLRDYQFHRHDTLVADWLKDRAATLPSLARAQRALFRMIFHGSDALLPRLNRERERRLVTLPFYADEVMGQSSVKVVDSATMYLFGIAQISSWHVRVLRWLGQHFDLQLHHFNPLVGQVQQSPSPLMVEWWSDENSTTPPTHPNPPLQRGREPIILLNRVNLESANELAPIQQSSKHQSDESSPSEDDINMQREQSTVLPSPLRGEGLGVRGMIVEALTSLSQGERGTRLLDAQSRNDTVIDQLRSLTDRYRDDDSIGDDLWSAWGRAGAESLRQSIELLEQPTSFDAVVLRSRDRARSKSTLDDLRAYFASGETPSARRDQDASVQVVACPGMMREVETVYQSILHNLQTTPDLKQTDIAVLATDMKRYRPALQSVFDRSPRRIRYNLADFSAASLSLFGSALLGLFDLAQTTLTRSRVFEVLLNPCILTRLGIEREQASNWLNWAETLGIYHGWDQADKQQRGYRSSPLYCWRLGLQRLRMGRIMEVVDEDAGTPSPRFGDVVPFADLASSDKDQLDVFCRAVEGLLPWLTKLRHRQLTGVEWSQTIRTLVAAFLAVPPDRSDEEEVRDQLLQALNQFALFDELRTKDGKTPPIPLALVREWVRDALETLEGTRGDYLTGGVTISALQPLRPVPFRIVYVLGLGEGMFPGSNNLSTLDLRAAERRPGDIHPAEANRFLLLEVLYSTRDKVYLMYTSRDVQRDQELHPCSPLNQLRRFMEQRFLNATPRVAHVPLQAHDLRYLQEQLDPATDVLHTYSVTDRLLALRDGSVQLDEAMKVEIEQRRRPLQPEFEIPRSTEENDTIPTIRLNELRRFLLNPAEAAVQRHLGLRDEDEIEPCDDEPFYTESPDDGRLIRHLLNRFVSRSMANGPEPEVALWRNRLAEICDDWRLRGRMPEGEFGVVDQRRLEQVANRRLLGPQGLASFVRGRSARSYCGPVLIGESFVPVGARVRFSALAFRRCTARLVGHFQHVWRSRNFLDLLVVSSSAKIATNEVSSQIVEPLLFYLMLKAGGDSSKWVGKRRLRVYIAHAQGLAKVVYPRISRKQARRYLRVLARDFLDRSSFDWLPLAIVTGNRDLRRPYQSRDRADDATRAEYASMLREAIEEDQQSRFAELRAMKTMELVPIAVPDDAWAKIRRRLWIVDSGPARRRRAALRGTP